MGTKHDDSCLIKAADDEPIFVLRAQDSLAPGVVRYWASLARVAGTPGPKLLEALQLADRMEAWQEQNRKKYPD